MVESTHFCSFRSSLDLFQEPHPRPLVPGLQRVLCQLCRGPHPPPPPPPSKLWSCCVLQASTTASAPESIAQRFVMLPLSNRWQTVTQHHRQALEMVQPHTACCRRASFRLVGIWGSQSPGVRRLLMKARDTGETGDFLLKLINRYCFVFLSHGEESLGLGRFLKNPILLSVIT